MTVDPSPPNTALQASQLCQQCGMCCDGTLFNMVGLKTGETSRVPAAKLPLKRDEKDKEFFNQPCLAFKDGCCSVYHDRPRACRSYHCILHRQVLNGSTDFDAAAHLVQQTRAEARWLRDHRSKEAATLPAPKKKLVPHELLTAWLKTDLPPTDAPEKSLSQSLSQHLLQSRLKLEKGVLEDSDIPYILRAFEHLKAIDRFFERARLLNGYAALVQQLHAQNRLSNPQA